MISGLIDSLRETQPWSLSSAEEGNAISKRSVSYLAFGATFSDGRESLTVVHDRPMLLQDAGYLLVSLLQVSQHTAAVIRIDHSLSVKRAHDGLQDQMRTIPQGNATEELFTFLCPFTVTNSLDQTAARVTSFVFTRARLALRLDFLFRNLFYLEICRRRALALVPAVLWHHPVRVDGTVALMVIVSVGVCVGRRDGAVVVKGSGRRRSANS